jgi:hypothetical protein
MYYRVAILANASTTWKWRSTVLSSLDALFRFLGMFRVLPQDRLRVFSSSSREEMGEMLAQENNGQTSHSVTAEQFLRECLLQVKEAGHPVVERTKHEKEGIASHATNHNSNASLHEINGYVVASYGRGIDSFDIKRLELETGAGGDHDHPYIFTLPSTLPQTLAWLGLMAKVQQGILQS